MRKIVVVRVMPSGGGSAYGSAVYIYENRIWTLVATSDGPIESRGNTLMITLEAEALASAAQVENWDWHHLTAYLTSFGEELLDTSFGEELLDTQAPKMDEQVREDCGHAAQPITTDFGCPQCGERKVRCLIVGEDHGVTCVTCQHVYSLDLTPDGGNSDNFGEHG